MPGGKLCLASLTFGQTLVSRAVCRVWRSLYALRPQIVGGCRPVHLQDFVEGGWNISHREVVCALGICTEVLVAA